MIVRRLLAGVLLAGLAAPTLGAAPRAAAPRTVPEARQALPLGSGARVFARSESEPEPPAEPSAAPAAEAAPGAPLVASMPSPEIAAQARAVFEANRAGKIDRTGYTADMSTAITDAALARVAAELRGLGDVKTFVQVRKVTQGATTVYVFRIECEHAPVIEEVISWNAAGKITYLRFGPVR